MRACASSILTPRQVEEDPERALDILASGIKGLQEEISQRKLKEEKKNLKRRFVDRHGIIYLVKCCHFSA